MLSLLWALAPIVIVVRAPAPVESSRDAYRRLAEEGNARAQAALGGIYSRERDPLAIAWLLNAARQGDSDAQAAVADWYREVHNLDAALHWYAEAAPTNPYAMWRLGRSYETGEGGRTSFTRAAELYRRASERGFAAAQNSLANFYMAGVGVALDYSAALRLYRAAAAQGYADAELNLAGMYYQGLGVDVNYEEAYRWALSASRHHARDAQAFLDEIVKKLP